MELQFETKGHFKIEVTNRGVIRETIEFDNLITNVGFLKWLKNGIGDTLKICVGNIRNTPNKNMATLPTGFSLYSRVNVKNGGMVDRSASRLVYRYVYKVSFPVETAPKTYNTIATVMGDDTTLFSIAKIKNMDGEPIDLNVIKDDQVTVVYELRMNIPRTYWIKRNVDIGFSGLTDITASIDAGDDIKLGTSTYRTTLKDSLKSDNNGGFEGKLDVNATEFLVVDDKIRLILNEKLKYKKYRHELPDIKNLIHDLGLFKIFVGVQPMIDRKVTSMDIDIGLSVDILRGES